MNHVTDPGPNTKNTHTISADPEGGQGEITIYMGFYREFAIGPSPPLEKVGSPSPRKMVDPLWNLG